MNTKNLIIGGIVGGIVFFFLGYLFYGTLLANFFKENSGYGSVEMEEMKWWALILGNLLYGFLLAYVFSKAGVSTVASGLIIGGLIGFLVSGSIDLVQFATTKMLNRNSLMADVATMTVMSAVTGAIIAAVMRMGSRTTTNSVTA